MLMLSKGNPIYSCYNFNLLEWNLQAWNNFEHAASVPEGLQVPLTITPSLRFPIVTLYSKSSFQDTVKYSFYCNKLKIFPHLIFTKSFGTFRQPIKAYGINKSVQKYCIL